MSFIDAVKKILNTSEFLSKDEIDGIRAMCVKDYPSGDKVAIWIIVGEIIYKFFKYGFLLTVALRTLNVF